MSEILRLETISSCSWCPHRYEFYEQRSGRDKHKCSKTKRIIKSLYTIPSWCPLEEYKK